MKNRILKAPFGQRVGLLTLLVFVLQSGLLILGACVSDPAFQNPFGECPDARPAKAVDVNVFYSPYANERYSTEADTVHLENFVFHLGIDAELSASTHVGMFPGQAYALSCALVYNFSNISAISVILKAPFQNLPTGTDISYLLIDAQDRSLDELKNYSNMFETSSFKLGVRPDNYSQLHTQTFLFLRDGTQKVFESISPTIQTQ